MNDSDKLTLSLIYSFYNNKKEIYISNNKLGEMLGISRTAASERITKLENLGYIKCNRMMINGKQRRTILPIKMVGKPNPLVGKPNRLVGEPTCISRSTDLSLVGEVGSIRLPLLLDKELDYILDTNIRLENLEGIVVDELTPEQRGKYFQVKNCLIKKEKENEKTRRN